MRVHIRHQHSYNARVYPRECTKGPTPSFKCYVRHTLRTKDGSLPFPPIPSFDASFMMHEYSFGLVGRVHETGIENCYLFFAKVDIDSSPSIKNKWIILVRELKEFSLEFFHFLRRFFPTRLEYSFGLGSNFQESFSKVTNGLLSLWKWFLIFLKVLNLFFFFFRKHRYWSKNFHFERSSIVKENYFSRVKVYVCKCTIFTLDGKITWEKIILELGESFFPFFFLSFLSPRENSLKIERTFLPRKSKFFVFRHFRCIIVPF